MSPLLRRSLVIYSRAGHWCWKGRVGLGVCNAAVQNRWFCWGRMLYYIKCLLICSAPLCPSTVKPQHHRDSWLFFGTHTPQASGWQTRVSPSCWKGPDLFPNANLAHMCMFTLQKHIRSTGKKDGPTALGTTQSCKKIKVIRSPR